MAHRVRGSVFLAIGLAILCIGVPAAQAAPAGSLDPTFGSAGTVTLTDPGSLALRGSVGLPDGSTIVAASNGMTAPLRVRLVKIDKNGSVDGSFIEDGFDSASWVPYPDVRALALAPDGTIVAVGDAATDGGGQAWLIARFNTDGSLDQTFGTDGAVVMPMAGYSAASAVAVQPDGAIVVGGAAEPPTEYVQHWVLARFDGQGSLDPSFGPGGVEVLPYTDYFGIGAIALQSDGDILASGWDSSSGTISGVVARFLPNGGVDNTYGTDGSTVMANFLPADISITSGGKVVLSGRAHGTAGWGAGVAELDANGSPDPAFGTGGFNGPLDPGTFEGAGDLAIQSDGSIVVSGDTTGPVGGLNFGMARFTGDGVLDSTFGTGGVVTEDVSPHHTSVAGAVHFQSDGRIVVTVRTEDAQGHPMIVLQRFFASDGPHTHIDSGPQGPVNITDVTFAFSSPDSSATFTCSLDGATFAACTSPKEYPSLAEGAHSFSVRATDAADNIGPIASRDFVVDTVAPVITIDTGPNGTVYTNKVTFAFSANEDGTTFACALDDQAFIPCESPTVLTGLSDGSHAFQVEATDLAGNTGSPAARAFTVDTTDILRPDALIALGSNAPVGEDIFNLTGSHQHALQGIGRRNRASFHVEIQNDGTLPDQFSVRARGSWQGCTLRYLHPGADVTAAVATGSFTTETLAPGTQTGLTLLVRVAPTAALGFRLPNDITITSQTFHPATDVVVAIVRILR
jgi:uncharacterized delta-60 repeat protein